MRNVNYGRFVDFMPPEPDYGGNIYQGNAEEASLRTAGIKKHGIKITIYDASLLEKMAARLKFIFQLKKKRALGVRTEKKAEVNPYSNPIPQLGLRLDKDGNKVVDDDYFRWSEERAIEKRDRKAAREVYEKKKKVEAELAKMLEDDTKADTDSKSFTK